MTLARPSLVLPAALLGAILALVFAGCAVAPQPLSVYQDRVRYEPGRAPETLPGTASIEVRQTTSPAVLDVWRTLARYGQNIELYHQAAQEMLSRDLAASGLFTAIAPAGSSADYRVVLEKHESKEGEIYEWNLKLSLLHGGSGQLLFSREVKHRWPPGTANPWSTAMPQLMTVLKAGVASYAQALRQQKEEQVMNTLPGMKLEELIAGSDRSVAFARARNRAIVAAKLTQLPAVLRDTRTDDLSALLVKIEQTILDLNHESEVAKDRAQQILAAGPGANPGASADALRDFAISYRERIELLKPIATAIKEEIANRNR